MTSRRWCFTVNNPRENEIEQWQLQNIKVLVAQLEQGQAGTIHLQGYLETKNPVRLAALKKLCTTAHWEKARGTRCQAIQYCLKEESSLGARWWLCEGSLQSFSEEVPSSLENLMNASSSVTDGGHSCGKERLYKIRCVLSEGHFDVIEKIADDDFDLWVRYHRAFEKYLLMKMKPRDFKTEVHVIQGPTGTGKSRWAMESYPGAYWKQRSQWWDGYMGQDTVIIDEFYGWLPFDLLLRLCDRYPLMIETKGGQTQFLAKTIVITSNMVPSSWYKNAYFPSFVRRVTKWHILPIWGEHKEYIEYGEFLKEASDNIFSP